MTPARVRPNLPRSEAERSKQKESSGAEYVVAAPVAGYCAGNLAGFCTGIDTPSHVFVSIGGGGFISGVSTALKARLPDTRIIGVETEGATAMTEALTEGHPVTIKPRSISKTLGAPFATERTLAAVQKNVEKVMVMPDRDAVDAVYSILDDERVLVEPAAGCVLAAAASHPASRDRNSHICLVFCGSNVSFQDLPEMAKSVVG